MVLFRVLVASKMFRKFDSKRYKKNFQKFADGTSMHGFTEFYYAKSILWQCFWLLIIVAALGVTIFQVTKAISQYTNQTTTTSVQVATQEDILYPPLRLCYPHWLYWFNWSKALEKNFTNDSIVYAMSYFSDVYISRNLTPTASQDFFDGLKLNNMSRIFDFYLSTTKPFPVFLQGFFPVEKGKFQFTLLDSDDADHGFVKKFHQSDTTYTLQLCYELNQSNIFYLVDKSLSSGKEQKETDINFLEIYIKYETFSTYKEVINDLEYMMYMNDWFHDSLSIRESSLNDYNFTTLPMILYPNAYDLQNYIFVNQEFNVLKINIKATIHHWKNSDKWPCKEDWLWIKKNVTNCETECERKYLSKCYSLGICNSVSFYDAILLDDYNEKIMPTFNIYQIQGNRTEPFNSSAFYASRTNSVLTTTIASGPNPKLISQTWDKEMLSEKENCTHKCYVLFGCKVYNFDFTAQPLILSPSKSLTKVVIEYPLANEILLMKEEDERSWEDFVGNVGGLIGIWTGASIVSIIQLIYLCCCVHCNDDNSKEKTEESDQNQQKIRRIKVSSVDSEVFEG